MEKRNQCTIIQSSDSVSVDSGPKKFTIMGRRFSQPSRFSKFSKFSRFSRRIFWNQLLFPGRCLQASLRFKVHSGWGLSSTCLILRIFNLKSFTSKITKISIAMMMLQSHSQSETLTHIHWISLAPIFIPSCFKGSHNNVSVSLGWALCRLSTLSHDQFRTGSNDGTTHVRLTHMSCGLSKSAQSHLICHNHSHSQSKALRVNESSS